MGNVDFVNGPTSQEFLANPYSPVQPWGHTGKDYAVPVGSNCFAIADGTVIWCGAGQHLPLVYCQELMMLANSPDSGNLMFIQHDGWVAGYFHLSGFVPGVDDGSKVTRGQVVCLSGNTGRSTGPHLHMECLLRPASSQPVYSRYNPTAQVELENRIAANQQEPVMLNQRRNGSFTAIMRDTPSTSGNPVGEIPANRLDVFVGYALGEEVTISGEAGVRNSVTSNIWYIDRGEDGNGADRYVSAALFTEQKITGLPNYTPANPVTNLAPNQRKVGPAGANVRREPRSASDLLRAVQPDKIEAFTHFVYGENVSVGGVTTNIWYKDSLGYVWAGVFTEQKTDGLIQFIPEVMPEPAPSIPQPEKPAYSFAKSISCVTEVIPAGEGNYEAGNFPSSPTTIVLHQFIAGALRHDVHWSSVVNEFKKAHNLKSSNLVIEAKKIIQMVKYGHRPYHAGPKGNEHLAFETYGGQDEETLNSVALAIFETEKLYGYKMKLDTHNHIMATECGDQIDLKDMRRRADILHDASNPKPIDPKPPVDDDTKDTELLKGFTDYVSNKLITEYLNEKKD